MVTKIEENHKEITSMHKSYLSRTCPLTIALNMPFSLFPRAPSCKALASLSTMMKGQQPDRTCQCKEPYIKFNGFLGGNLGKQHISEARILMESGKANLLVICYVQVVHRLPGGMHAWEAQKCWHGYRWAFFFTGRWSQVWTNKVIAWPIEVRRSEMASRLDIISSLTLVIWFQNLFGKALGPDWCWRYNVVGQQWL